MTGATNATGIVVVEETDPQITHVCLAPVKVPTLSRIPVREPRIPSGTGAHACTYNLHASHPTTPSRVAARSGPFAACLQAANLRSGQATALWKAPQERRWRCTAARRAGHPRRCVNPLASWAGDI
ncbi:hypothetical protein NUW54_g7344 [Trametes sanguinea]|uniref:Uncharacterized protein n=1 Tax=Trametes sanguinea TaxID=158606 RepID=A0ACC1PLF7_9APHY|nr:hypothetical protein NUW54_g7344 [Trametes sanguinea]